MKPEYFGHVPVLSSEFFVMLNSYNSFNRQAVRSDPAIFVSSLKPYDSFQAGKDHEEVLGRLQAERKEVFRHFMQHWQGVGDLRYVSFEGTAFIYFRQRSRVYRLCYDVQDRLNHVSRYYGKEELLPSVRELLEEAFPGFDISAVNEVSYRREVLYLVSIRKSSGWKHLKIVDGTWEIYEEMDFN